MCITLPAIKPLFVLNVVPVKTLNIKQQKKQAAKKKKEEKEKSDIQKAEEKIIRVEKYRQRQRNRSTFLIEKRHRNLKTKRYRNTNRKIDTGQEQLFDTIRSFCLKFKNNKDCLSFLKEVFWPEGIFCPYCEGKKIWTFKKNKHHHKCATCSKQFNVTAGTIFANAKIPLYKILEGILFETAVRGGLTINEFVQMIGVSGKTAYARLNGIRRYGFNQDIFATIMKNPEAFGFYNMPKPGEDDPHHVDTTVADGKEVNRPKHRKRGRKGGVNKTNILMDIQTGGYARGEVIPDLTKDTMLQKVRELIPAGAIVYSDSTASLNGLNETHRHDKVNHEAGENARGQVTSNPVERLNGVYKTESKKHQNNFSRRGKALFLNAVIFRNNTRFLTPSDKLRLAILIMSKNLLPLKRGKGKLVTMKKRYAPLKRVI